MNELAKSLAFKAGFVGESMFPVVGTCQETALENLVELVVSECARMVQNTNLEDVDGGDSAVLRAAAEQVRKNFGLK